jgi:uncharacterized protein YoxC
MENIIPWQAILNNPNSAWALAFIVLLVYVMIQNGKREERLSGIIEGALKDLTAAIAGLCSDVRSVKEDVEAIKRGDLP